MATVPDVETRERLVAVEVKVDTLVAAMPKLDEKITAVDDKLDKHMIKSTENHVALATQMSAVTSKIDGIAIELRQPSGVMALLHKIVENPGKAGQVLVLLMTLGSFVAGVGAWLNGGNPFPAVPALIGAAGAAEAQKTDALKDDKQPVDAATIVPATPEVKNVVP
jgi:hypothetical protein